MSKHLIKIESTPHGVLGVRHAGRDQQYCEAGEQVILKWQPDAKWGLQEAHYTDGDGNVTPIDLTRVKVNGRDVVVFTMPDANITIGGTFKRFVIEDWTEEVGKNTKGTAFNRPTLGVEDAGFEYYDETLKKKILWNGNYWVNVDGTPMPLTLIAAEAASTVSLTQVGVATLTDDYEYSLDGLNWSAYTIGDVVTLASVGNFVQFRGTNTTTAESSSIYKKFVMTGKIYATGDVTSLLNEIGGDVALSTNYSLYSLFYEVVSLITPPNLPSSILSSYCYQQMFQGCTGLTQAPALPATTLVISCYYAMFQGCTGLTQAPALPATTLVIGCYNSMFYDCTGLTSAPALPATTLAGSCYNYMFQGCTGVTSHDVATLNNSQNIFYNNSSCASFTIHADIPPTISNSTITGLKADCVIYVPAASVDAYKAAQYWSARAAYIQAIP